MATSTGDLRRTVSYVTTSETSLRTSEVNGRNSGYRPAIGISIVNYGSIEDTRSLLGDIARFHEHVGLSVVIVDNSAYEDTAASRTLRHICESMDYSCEYLPRRNLGYAGGTNVALAALAGSDVDAVWVLNADVRLDASGAEALSKGLAANRGVARIFATTLRDSVSGVLRPGISVIHVLTTRTKIARVGKSLARSRWQTAFPEGYSFIITRPALALLQQLDDDLFLFYEEAELMTRASCHGIGLGVLPGVVVEHLRGIVTGSTAAVAERPLNTLYHASRSCVLFYRRHYPYLMANCVLARCLQAVQLCVAARPALGAAVMKGILAGLSTTVQRKGMCRWSDVPPGLVQVIPRVDTESQYPE